MTWHLFGMIVTDWGIAANNRGENEGNISTLQKILWKDATYTCVSAEAIRRGLRRVWADAGKNLRENTPGEQENFNPEKFLDDDVLGFMKPEAAKAQENDQANSKKKGTVTSRTGPLNVSRAISLLPYRCEVTFNSRSGDRNRSSLYGTEIHSTAYQFGWAITPIALTKPERIEDVVTGLTQLGAVGGNHGRFLFDFSPQSIIFRWTQDFAPRFLYCFEVDGDGAIKADKVERLVSRGDIKGSELWIGGDIAASPLGEFLKTKNARVCHGVVEVVIDLLKQIKQDLNLT